METMPRTRQCSIKCIFILWQNCFLLLFFNSCK